jgi:hypothetical protein
LNKNCTKIYIKFDSKYSKYIKKQFLEKEKKLNKSYTMYLAISAQHRPRPIDAAAARASPPCLGRNLGLGLESAAPLGPKASPATASHPSQSDG